MLNALLIIVILILVVFLTGDIIARKVIYPTRTTLSKAKKMEQDSGNWKDYDSKDKEELDFTLSDGYMLHGTMVYNDRTSKKFVIHTHGFSFNRYGGVKYVDTFADAGYNVYLYDLRSHGMNGRGMVGMGEQESKDLVELIRLFKDKFGADIILGLHGESLGAFSSLIALVSKPDIKFCIEDCSYSDTETELKFQFKQQKIPTFLYPEVRWNAKVLYKQHWADYDAREAVKNTNIPILFIHGEADQFTPPYMAKDLFDACSSKNKKLVYFEGANHAQSMSSNPERYARIVKDFIATCE